MFRCLLDFVCMVGSCIPLKSESSCHCCTCFLCSSTDLFSSFKLFHIFSLFSWFYHIDSSLFMISAGLMMLLCWCVYRSLMVIYLVYISIFTVCCINRPLKDIPENYTKASNDHTIKVKKTFKVWNVTAFTFLCTCVCEYLTPLFVFRRAIRHIQINCV